MELTTPYFDVFYTVHYFIFYYNFYYYFSWFSDAYAVPSKRGTEALIKSFFQLASKLRLWFVKLFTFTDTSPATVSRAYVSTFSS